MNIEKWFEDWPKLLRFLAYHGTGGAFLGLFAALAMMTLDVARIGTLFAENGYPVVAVVLFFASFAVTFSSLAMGVAVMLLPKDDSFPSA